MKLHWLLAGALAFASLGCEDDNAPTPAPAPVPQPEPEPTPAPVPDPEPIPDPEPAPEPIPDPLPPPEDDDEEPAPVPDPEPQPEPTPDPTPEPEPDPAPLPDDGDDDQGGDEDPVPTPDPIPVPEPTPEPIPDPEPQPEPQPDPAPLPTDPCEGADCSQGDVYPDVEEEQEAVVLSAMEADDIFADIFGFEFNGKKFAPVKYWSKKIASAAQKYLGMKYEFGGCRGDSYEGCDASGFIYRVLNADNGIYKKDELILNVHNQYRYLHELSFHGKTADVTEDRDEWVAGSTILFFGGYTEPADQMTHAALYLGRDKKGRAVIMDASPEAGVALRVMDGTWLDTNFKAAFEIVCGCD